MTEADPIIFTAAQKFIALARRNEKKRNTKLEEQTRLKIGEDEGGDTHYSSKRGRSSSFQSDTSTIGNVRRSFKKVSMASPNSRRGDDIYNSIGDRSLRLPAPNLPHLVDIVLYVYRVAVEGEELSLTLRPVPVYNIYAPDRAVLNARAFRDLALLRPEERL